MHSRLLTSTACLLVACGGPQTTIEAVPMADPAPVQTAPAEWSFTLPPDSSLSTELIGFGRDSVFAAVSHSEGEAWRLHGATRDNRWTVDVPRVAYNEQYEVIGEGLSACENAAACEPAYLMPRLLRYDGLGDAILYVDGQSRVIGLNAQTGERLLLAPLGEDLYPIAMATSEAGITLLATHGDAVHRVDIDRSRCGDECPITSTQIELQRAEDEVVHAIAEFASDGTLIVATPSTLARFNNEGARLAYVRTPTEHVSVVDPAGDGVVAIGTRQTTVWNGASCDDASCVAAFEIPTDVDASILHYEPEGALAAAAWWSIPEEYEGAPRVAFNMPRVVTRELGTTGPFHVLPSHAGAELGTFEATVEDGLLTMIDMGDRVGVVVLPEGEEPTLHVLPLPESLQTARRHVAYYDLTDAWVR